MERAIGDSIPLCITGLKYATEVNFMVRNTNKDFNIIL